MKIAETIVALSIIFAFCGWYFYDKIKILIRNQNMYKKIGWIAEKQNYSICYSESVRLRDHDLLYYITQEQISLSLTKEFYIDFSSEIEKKDAEEILNLHKTKVIQNYFSDLLTNSKTICKLTSEEYYFYSLYCFIYRELEENKHFYHIYENREYTDKNHYKCKLTHFGRTYYKLFLITLLYVEQNENVRKLFEYINPKMKEDIKEKLEKNEASFWNYSP